MRWKMAIMGSEPEVQISEREGFVFHIAAEAAVGIRNSLAKHGIRQASDVVNGMFLAGLLLEKSFPEQGGTKFIDVLSENKEVFRRLAMSDRFAEYLAELSEHKIGVSDLTPSEMVVQAGMGAEGTMTELALEHGLSRDEALNVAAFVAVMIIVANSSLEVVDIVLDQMIEGARQQNKVWSDIFPSTSELMEEDEEDRSNGEN